MTLREAYKGAIEENFESLSLLIEFLVLEKQVLTFEDDVKELDLYFLPKHKERMNKLLLEYKKGAVV